MKEQFEMVAKTFQGLEDILADELRALGALNVEPGRRMVSFEGDLEMLYKANLCCRTALRILKPFYKFIADDTDSLYEMVKEFDWGSILTIDKTFSIDTVAFSDEFTHSRFVTYRVKDAIVDWFKDRYGEDKRPGVRLQDADVMINVHIAGERVTLSLDSSGESLHRRGYRVEQTEAPINEVLAAGIILRSGWRGDCPLVDPMCGSGTFLVEAALIAANINPGVYRKGFAFENWPDFDAELFDRLYNDDSEERDVAFKIYGADISPKAIAIAEKNIKSAGVGRYIDLQIKPLSQWDEAPADGILITNPPYGERISSDDMDGLYEMIGNKLKNVFKGYHAWIIGYRQEYFDKIHLSPSVKLPILNGSLECELREYIIFEGDYKSFRAEGGRIRHGSDDSDGDKMRDRRARRQSDSEWRAEARGKGFGGKERRGGDRKFDDRRPQGRPGDRRGRFDERRERFGEGKPKRYDDARRHESDDPRNPLEERYQPREGRFSRKPRPEGRFGDRKFDKRRFDDDRRGAGRFGNRRFEEPREEKPVSDNPLAIRRNEDALKSITGKAPSLLKDGTTIMRSRKGWKKRDDEDGQTND